MNAIITNNTATSSITQIPLNKLVPSKANVRRTGRDERIDELAASIAAHGLLQNLTVRPTDKGKHEVIAGGRRLLALRRLAKQKLWEKDALVPCQLVEGGNVTELSLAENALQAPMHPADQFEAFAELQRQEMPVEDIAARFGVSPNVVTQRLKLGAVSPKLMEVYRAGDMNLDQLSAFVICDDHERQEEVWEGLGYNRSRATILRALSEGQVPSDDPRALFVGIEAYLEAGGTILRDLFDAEGGGYLESAELLNRLVDDKLCAEAERVRAEGWLWVQIEAEFDHGMTAGKRRVYPAQRSFTEAEEARLEELSERYDALCEPDGELDEATQAELAKIDDEMDAIRGADVYADEDRSVAGAYVTIDHDGHAQVLRGFIRPEDDPRRSNEEADETGDPLRPKKSPDALSASLLAELTAHRTAALANELAKQPNFALTVLVHAMAAETFHDRLGRVSCVGVQLRRTNLRSFAKEIDESQAMQEIAERDEAWNRRIPETLSDLWPFVAALSEEERLALLAHCLSLTVDAVRSNPLASNGGHRHADALATALSLDMTGYWQPTVASYLGRVSKGQIAGAVREGVSPEAAQTCEGLKKGAMAERAEKLLSGKNWLPEVLR